jgi:hypothetical protein
VVQHIFCGWCDIFYCSVTYLFLVADPPALPVPPPKRRAMGIAGMLQTGEVEADFKKDLAYAFASSNIPLQKLAAEPLRKFFDRCCSSPSLPHIKTPMSGVKQEI